MSKDCPTRWEIEDAIDEMTQTIERWKRAGVGAPPRLKRLTTLLQRQTFLELSDAAPRETEAILASDQVAIGCQWVIAAEPANSVASNLALDVLAARVSAIILGSES